MYIPRPMITLCFLEKPVDFAAMDGKPVNTLFTIVSPTVRTHLHLLSTLAFALREDGFRAAILGQAPREEIQSQARAAEAALAASQAPQARESVAS
jgi:PTS system nitrogen regulatory IIA component